MNNILITIEVIDNTTDNNISFFKKVLSKLDTSVRVLLSSTVKLPDIDWCDIYIANRPNSIWSEKIAMAAKEFGRIVVIALDDDIVNLHKNNPNYWKNKYTKKCLEIGDALLSPSPLILQDYCELYHLSPIKTISFVEKNDIKKTHRVGGKIRIVYPAGKDHVSLFNTYILPFFDSFIERFKDKIEFVFVGVKPDVSESESVRFVKGMSYKDYIAFMNENDFDIGIAPLHNDNFSARKYFAKYLEYSRFGIMGIYSAVPPYTFVVDHMNNGVLVEGNYNNWEQSLVRAIENPDDIFRLANNAQNDIQMRFSIENAVKSLRDSFPEIERFRSQLQLTSFKMPVLQGYMFKFHDFIAKVCYHLKNDGIQYFWNR